MSWGSALFNGYRSDADRRWVAGNSWNACNVTCGGGVANRTVQCQYVSNNTAADDSLCAGQNKPATTRECSSQVRLEKTFFLPVCFQPLVDH
jgi:hypothetical protein